MTGTYGPRGCPRGRPAPERRPKMDRHHVIHVLIGLVHVITTIALVLGY